MTARLASVIVLDVASLPCIVNDGTFDAWGWCASDVLEWRRPGPLDLALPIESTNPSGLVFVMREECTFLPRELARLHAYGYGLEDELALAPYAIDDATDLLYERRVRPRDVFWLAAPSLAALVWGLHDWAHFHNHGTFDKPAMTELACDLVALAWLRKNQDRVGLDEATTTRVASDLARVSQSRFEAEGALPPVGDLAALYTGPYPDCALG
jgi:hypothetical protein